MASKIANLSEDQIDELRFIFDHCDVNSDGVISPYELWQLLKEFGQNPTEAEIITMIHGLDSNKSLSIDFEEFAVLMVDKLKKNYTEQEVRDVFRIFDVNKTGMITFEEIHHVANNMGEELTKEEANVIVCNITGGNADLEWNRSVNLSDFMNLMIHGVKRLKIDRNRKRSSGFSRKVSIKPRRSSRKML